MEINNEDEWRSIVAKLDLLEFKLEENYQTEKIGKKEKEKIKKLINHAWIKIWNLHPDQSPLAKELFELHFG